MHETQQTVGEWMYATFPGADPASPRKAIRALEEMVELCVAAGASVAEVHSAVSRATESIPGVSGSRNRPEPDNIPAEAADVLIVLYGLATLKGFDLHAEVDRKMTKNRARKWAANGDGTGYHIKPAEAGTGSTGI